MEASPKQYINVIVMLLYCCECVIGTDSVNISLHTFGSEPAERTVQVCSRNKLELSCSTSGRLTEWSILQVDYTYLIGSVSQNIPLRSITINSVTFNFSRVSSPASLPLITKLVISPANSSISGTTVSCRDIERNKSALTTVSVINREDLDTLREVVQNVHVVNFSSLLPELEESDGVKLLVSLQWDETNPHQFPYHIDILPETSHNITVANEIIMIKVEVLFNTLYNVSIGAACEQRSLPLIGLYYRTCGTLPDNVTIIDHRDGGTKLNTTFIYDYCPPDTTEVPTGLTNTTGSTVRQGSSAVAVALVSSVLTFLVTFLFTFIIGCTCGIYFNKKCKKPMVNESQPQLYSIAVYEDVLPTDTNKVIEDQYLALEHNVAYAASNEL